MVWELRTNTDNRIIDPVIPNFYAKIGLNIQECGPNGAGEGFFPYRGRSQSGLSGPGLTVSTTTLNRSKNTIIVNNGQVLGPELLNRGSNRAHISCFPFRGSLRDSLF